MRLIIFSLFLFLMFSCNSENNKKYNDQSLVIKYTKPLDSIPSASGITVMDSMAYIIGDDATAIYELNLSGFTEQRIFLPSIPHDQYREPKSSKHDFESSTFVNWNGKTYLLALGSGSNMPSRDSMMLLNIRDFKDAKVYSLKNFYRKLQGLTQTDSLQWNIEGATAMRGKLIIANRADNSFFQLTVSDFLSFVIENNSFPVVDHYKLTLPKLDGYEARLSGLATISTDLIAFCASVEATDDWTKDGPISGSYVGWYATDKRKILGIHLLKDDKGTILKQKLESVDIVDTENNIINMLAVSDNDDGKSTLLSLHLIRK